MPTPGKLVKPTLSVGCQSLQSSSGELSQSCLSSEMLTHDLDGGWAMSDNNSAKVAPGLAWGSDSMPTLLGTELTGDEALNSLKKREDSVYTEADRICMSQGFSVAGSSDGSVESRLFDEARLRSITTIAPAAMTVADLSELDEGSHIAGFKRIFENYLDVHGTGAVNVGEMSRVFSALCADDPETVEKIMSALSAGGNDAQLTLSQCTNLLFQAKERGCRGRFAVMLVQVILPFFYSVCTRLPFITVALETMDKRNGTLSQVAYVLGVYQTSRALANALISKLQHVPPVVLHAAMTVMGFIGWGINYAKADGGIEVLYTLGFVGLSESVVCLQQGLLAETAADSASGIPSEKVLTMRMRRQYTAISFGSCFAYVVGGWMYSQYGFKEVCLLGVSCEAAGLVCVVVYFLISASTVFLLEVDGAVQFRKLVVKLTAVDEIVRAALKTGPSRHDLREAMPTAVKSQVYTQALRELFGDFLGFKPVAKRASRLSGVFLPRRSTQRRRSTMASNDSQGRLMYVTSQGKLDMQTLKAKLVPLVQLNMHAAKFKGRELQALVDRAARLLDRSGQNKVAINDFLVCLLPRVQLALNPGAAFQVDVVFWYLYLIVITQAVMALCIGTFLSTALLMYSTHGMDSSKMGLLLGTGEGLGCLVIAMSSNSCMSRLCGPSDEGMGINYIKDTLFALTSRPLHVPTVLLVIGTATMLFSLPPTGAAIAAQMVALACNDLSVTLLNELTATSAPPQHFQRLQSGGQWLRRVGNMVTAFTGPMLHGVASWLPWTVYGGVVCVWALFLWAVLFVRAKEISPFSEHRGLVSIFKTFISSGDKKGRSSTWHLHERAHLSSRKVASEPMNLLKMMEIDVEERLLQNHLEIEKLGNEIEKLRKRAGAQQRDIETLRPLRDEVDKLRRQLLLNSAV